MRGSVDPLAGERQLVGARDGFDDDVGGEHAGSEEGLAGAGDKRGDNGRIPPGVDNGYAEGGAWEGVSEQWGRLAGTELIPSCFW